LSVFVFLVLLVFVVVVQWEVNLPALLLFVFAWVLDPPADECVELVDAALAGEPDADLERAQAQFVGHEHLLDAVQGLHPAQHGLARGYAAQRGLAD